MLVVICQDTHINHDSSERPRLNGRSGGTSCISWVSDPKGLRDSLRAPQHPVLRGVRLSGHFSSTSWKVVGQWGRGEAGQACGEHVEWCRVAQG